MYIVDGQRTRFWPGGIGWPRGANLGTRIIGPTPRAMTNTAPAPQVTEARATPTSYTFGGPDVPPVTNPATTTEEPSAARKAAVLVGVGLGAKLLWSWLSG